MIDASSLERHIKGEILRGAPMSRFTSWQVGGPVDYLAFPADLQDLAEILRWCRGEEVPYFVLGNGTNLLVRNGGLRAMAISLVRAFRRMEEVQECQEGAVVRAEAGAPLSELVEFCCRKELAGLEFAAGIPGSVGGALFMNAGAFRGEVKDVLAALDLVEPGGEMREKRREELSPAYRSMGLAKGEMILAGSFHLRRGDGAQIRSRVEDFLAGRRARHPLDLPSAGSVFKNPARSPAGKLIEETGLKGRRRGGAEVSEKHGNFIVNRGGATAGDILALIEEVQKRVFEAKGVWLEPEVRILGED